MNDWRAPLDRERLENHSLLRSIVQSLDELKRHLDSLARANSLQVGEVTPIDDDSNRDPDSLADSENPEDDDDWPLLPSDLANNIEMVVKNLDLKSFFDDPRYNPNRVELTQAQKVKAYSITTAARARFKIIDVEIQAGCAEVMEYMRKDGEFIKYGQGERPQPAEPGLITVGEVTEDKGMRLYYFYPEEFPEIYEMREEKKKVSERALRELLSLVAE